jgi:uncharacterized membrane protein YphA (DoxX/SURF4 family)
MMASTLSTTGRSFPSWPKYALRTTFGMIWLIDAVLKWLPGFRSGYMGMISGAGQGQPGWLRPWFSFRADLQSPHPAVYAYLVAVLETLVALAILFGVARKVSYFAAAAFSVVIWAAAEGSGGPYTSGASDIGTAIIYALVFMCLLTLAVYTGPDTYSVDHYLEKKISWWWKVAEFGPPPSSSRPRPSRCSQQRRTAAHDRHRNPLADAGQPGGRHRALTGPSAARPAQPATSLQEGNHVKRSRVTALIGIAAVSA